MIVEKLFGHMHNYLALGMNQPVWQYGNTEKAQQRYHVHPYNY